MKLSTLVATLALSFSPIVSGFVINADFTRCDYPPRRPVAYIDGTYPFRYVDTAYVSPGVYRIDTDNYEDIDITVYLSADGNGFYDQGASQQSLKVHFEGRPRPWSGPSTLFMSDNPPLRSDWEIYSAYFEDTQESTSHSPYAEVTVMYC